MRVTLLLHGGFQLGVEVGPGQFDQILATLTPADGSRRSTLLRLNTGHDTLTVPSDRIVAVRTASDAMAAVRRATVPSGPRTGRNPLFRFVGGEPTSYSPGRCRYPSPALVADGFLTPEENAQLLRLAIDRQREFVPSRTATNVEGYRVSRVLFRPRAAETLMRARIAQVLPEIIRRFRFRDFRPGSVEVQLTAHNDGNYYRIHNDNGSGNSVTAGRVLTFVYYFCRLPRRFRGGGLRLYESVARNGYWTPGRTTCEIAPENNRIVFFPSRFHHEVLPVVCPSHRFEDGRFTINGWIHRAPATARH
jgi:Rps23 Pro-64 3,4-dihydroxylase Tpa1-like proline 4-hydroxylase